MQMDGYSVNSVLRTKLFNIDNLKDDPFDFIPRDVENKTNEKPRKASSSVRFVMIYKGSRENFVTALETIMDSGRYIL